MGYTVSGVWRYISCRQISKDLNILPVAYKYIVEVICHITLYIEKLERNTEIYNHYYTWQKPNLHVRYCRRNVLKKGVMNTEINLFNKLPSQIRKLEKSSI
jgi:hypothetical protein